MKKTSESKENLVPSSSTEFDDSPQDEQPEQQQQKSSRQADLNNSEEYVLSPIEKKFLLTAERGDCAGVKNIIRDFQEKPEEFDINCVDPLNRSALIAAIENENIELIRLLLEEGIKVKDALLHAISEEYVEAVETLLLWEEDHHEPGQPYTWEAVDRSSSTFTPDITPLILAAHRNNYEILKILLDRGATLPMPHDVRCGCDECISSSEQDSLRHSQSRINAYRALSSSSLIALSSRDPILTAFELSWELRRLSRMETEFRNEYNEMRQNVMEFSTSLLDHSRTSYELEVMLNFNPEIGADIWDPGERQTLERLKLAIKYKQKMFVSHPNVQQLLAAIWYDGLPGFRRKAMVGQLVQVAKLGAMFPIYSSIYIMAPNSEMGQFMKKPFVKFICHSTSYAFFLMLLGAASQRIEYLALEFIGTPWLLEILDDWKRRERGALPGPTECGIMFYIISLVFGEVKSLWNDGILEYISDLWNIIDVISNTFYITWIGLRCTSYYLVQRDASIGLNPWYPREQWHPFDPMLLSEGAFAAGMIFSFLKLVHIFSINPHLGPLQVSLGRMIIDIIKFFFIYTLVLFAFGCGLNQLLWYYADLEKQKCYHLPNDIPDFDNNEKACGIWRRFTNLFETSQSLFWASFGLVDLMAFELQGIKSFTRFWALLMFGSYSVINIIVLLNMLIAMMSNSYQIISERSDTEWKFARSQLWMSYFEDGSTVPPPFNLFPTMKLFNVGKKKRNTKSLIRRSLDKAQRRHDNVMKLLVRRYVTAEQRKRDDFGITEDDVMEIRQDISSLRYELIDILRQNGMKTPNVNPIDLSLAGKKGKMVERRILKDFQIGFVEGIVNEVVSGSKEVKDVFSSIAKAIGKKASQKTKKEDWNAIVRQNTTVRDPIGSKRASLIRRDQRSLRRHILATANQGLSMDTEKLVEYNPKLSDVTKTTRVAYVKFMARAFKDTPPDDISVENEKEGLSRSSSKAAIDMALKSIIKDSPAREAGEIPPSTSSGELDDKKGFRPKTPIPEDPELSCATPIDPQCDTSTSEPPSSEDAKRTISPTPEATADDQTSETQILSSDAIPPEIASPLPSSSPEPNSILKTSPNPSSTEKISSTTSELKSESEISKSPEPSSSQSTEPDKEKKKEQKKSVKLLTPDESNPSVSMVRPVTPTTERGKSKITGKTITGWL